MHNHDSLSSTDRMSLLDKVRMINGGFVALVVLLGLIGTGMLYSAGGSDWQPWAWPQMTRFFAGLVLMLAMALVDIRVWLRIAYPFYIFVFGLLIFVAVMGHVGMGAQRWMRFGFLGIQPSELMKIALVMALARYFHGLEIEQIKKPLRLVAPSLLVLAPVGLVLLQPNLGTAILLVFASLAIFFVAGVQWWKFAAVFALAALILPLGWHYYLHDYQKARLMTFMDPMADPLGTGYNILQSQIALGSGGLWGKGFAMGTQSQLQFLPEKHTDFIFVVLAEEFGLSGALLLLLLYFLVLCYGFMIALTSRSRFSRLCAFGLTTTIFLYVFVNVAMVTGLIPVVGIPLPLISYGGSAMMTLLLACGLLLSLSVHRNIRISRTGNIDF